MKSGLESQHYKPTETPTSEHLWELAERPSPGLDRRDNTGDVETRETVQRAGHFPDMQPT